MRERLIMESTLVCLMLAIVGFLLSLLSYQPSDPGWSGTYTGYEGAATTNLLGRYGAYTSDFLHSQFGWAAYLFLLPMCQGVYFTFKLSMGRREQPSIDALLMTISSTAAAFLFVIVSAAVMADILLPTGRMPQSGGGVVGQLIASRIAGFGEIGRVIITFIVFVISTQWSFRLSWLNIVGWLWRSLLKIFQTAASLVMWPFKTAAKKAAAAQPAMTQAAMNQAAIDQAAMNQAAMNQAAIDRAAADQAAIHRTAIHRTATDRAGIHQAGIHQAATDRAAADRAAADRAAADRAAADRAAAARAAAGKAAPVQPAAEQVGPAAGSPTDGARPQPDMFAKAEKPPPAVRMRPPATDAQAKKATANAAGRQEFSWPNWKLLNPVPESQSRISEDMLASQSEELQRALAEYGIRAEVMEVFAGPVVTRFELQPEPGFKVARLTSIVQDIARALSVVSVRILEVIEGKAYFGVEIPNRQRNPVLLSQLMSTKADEQIRQMQLPVVLGADISGRPVRADLATMPHLIVSGATGAGKSVSIHTMLSSLLLHCDPLRLRLALIDPKMLELAGYNGLPHLLAPVVTEMAQAKDALHWCIEEMEQRYRRLAEAGVRDLQGYNAQVGEQAEALPRILVVVDELADLMMTGGKVVEQAIVRIAQKSRAAGIHLLLATQRPSVDIITGLIKSNIPARIAFQVTSSVDSRTILDQTGAEQLLGKGDMLFLHPSRNTPARVHGAFVGEEEVARLVRKWREYPVPENFEQMESFPSGEPAPNGAGAERRVDGAEDDLYSRAVEYIRGSRKVSTSALQRHLGIGFNRAARLIEAMEAKGIVSAPSDRGIRTLLADRAADHRPAANPTAEEKELP